MSNELLPRPAVAIVFNTLRQSLAEAIGSTGLIPAGDLSPQAFDFLADVSERIVRVLDGQSESGAAS